MTQQQKECMISAAKNAMQKCGFNLKAFQFITCIDTNSMGSIFRVVAFFKDNSDRENSDYEAISGVKKACETEYGVGLYVI